jgi:manganese transport protein
LVIGLIALLGYVIVVPALQRWRRLPVEAMIGMHGPSGAPQIDPAPAPRRIAVAVDFSHADKTVLAHAVTLALAAGRGARVLLFHVVESGGARIMGVDLGDKEAREDQERLELYAAELAEHDVEAESELGFGEPADELARLVDRHKPDLIVMGSHGHHRMGDLVHGTSVERLRHQVRIPVMVVPSGE